MRDSIRRTAAGLIIVSFLGITAAACGDDLREEFNDSPRGAVNDQPADIISFPDGFGNAATKCDHGHRLYSSRIAGEASGRALAVVPNDPTCPGSRP